jgi:2-polyprenyl-6-methoxyphenol hydroxylase-like FAD-dependent oxidoreductase
MAQWNRHYEVAIVGGGIAGATLAIMCEKFDIDYIMLEARNSVQADRGSGIILQPNGLQILDQLGLMDVLEDALVPLASWVTLDGDGKVMNSNRVQTTYRERCSTHESN